MRALAAARSPVHVDRASPSTRRATCCHAARLTIRGSVVSADLTSIAVVAAGKFHHTAIVVRHVVKNAPALPAQADDITWIKRPCHTRA
jgi:hypothetical protein